MPESRAVPVRIVGRAVLDRIVGWTALVNSARPIKTFGRVTLEDRVVPTKIVGCLGPVRSAMPVRIVGWTVPVSSAVPVNIVGRAVLEDRASPITMVGRAAQAKCAVPITIVGRLRLCVVPCLSGSLAAPCLSGSFCWAVLVSSTTHTKITGRVVLKVPCSAYHDGWAYAIRYTLYAMSQVASKDGWLPVRV